jgi:hypothetical protein
MLCWRGTPRAPCCSPWVQSPLRPLYRRLQGFSCPFLFFYVPFFTTCMVSGTPTPLLLLPPMSQTVGGDRPFIPKCSNMDAKQRGARPLCPLMICSSCSSRTCCAPARALSLDDLATHKRPAFLADPRNLPPTPVGLFFEHRTSLCASARLRRDAGFSRDHTHTHTLNTAPLWGRFSRDFFSVLKKGKRSWKGHANQHAHARVP